MPETIEKDVVVVGYGGAGAVAAIEACDLGADVLLIEKTAHPGGTTMLAGGYMRATRDPAGARRYLDRINGGRVAPELVEALVDGMATLPAYLHQLAERAGAVVEEKFGDDLGPHDIADLYDWPGAEALGWAGIKEVPGFTGYPWVHFAKRGQNYVRVVESNVEQRPIEVWFEAAARQLVIEDSAVRGVVVKRGDETVTVRARRGVILATGGFQFNARLLKAFMEIPEIHPIGHPGATGDGLEMASAAGADLWHMWHVHGSYGFKFEEFPMGFRIPLGGARWNERPVAWILVDQQGRRFANEVPPAPQDTGHRPLQTVNPETGNFDRIPAWMLLDENGLRRGPIARPIASNPEHYYEWSTDNEAEVAKGWIHRADTLEALAGVIGVSEATLRQTIARWNTQCAGGEDTDFQRPPGTFHPIEEPPYYAAEVRPVLSNTQGGPRHDASQRVLRADGSAIPGLYAVGELGSFFGHIYLLGGNLSEGLIGGRIAARNCLKDF